MSLSQAFKLKALYNIITSYVNRERDKTADFKRDKTVDFKRDKTADFKGDKTADFQNKTK